MQLTSLRQIGNSVGLTIKQEELARAGAREGDQVAVVPVGNGLRVRILTPSEASMVETVDDRLDHYDDVLRDLDE